MSDVSNAVEGPELGRAASKAVSPRDQVSVSRPKARIVEVEYFDTMEEALAILKSDDHRGGSVVPVHARSPLWHYDDPRQIGWRLERPVAEE